MNIRKLLAILSFVLLTVLCTAGCATSATPQLVNTTEFSMNQISHIGVNFGANNVFFYKSASGKVLIKEYMNYNSSLYYAKIKQSNGNLTIQDGNRPWFSFSFKSYIEIYLPASYNGILEVHTTNGHITSENLPSMLDAFHLNTTSGNTKLASVNASSIKLETTSGEITCQQVEGDLSTQTTSGTIQIENGTGPSSFTGHTTSGNLLLGSLTYPNISLETTSGHVTCSSTAGNVHFVTTSGNLQISKLKGEGHFESTSSGNFDVSLETITGDITAFNKNGNITLSVPAKASFAFAATTKEGSVSTPFDAQLQKSGSDYTASIGNTPTALLNLETRNGNIYIKQS